jgi:hypothetical protein
VKGMGVAQKEHGQISVLVERNVINLDKEIKLNH